MALSPQFNLRWNNHSYNIVQVFLEQLSSESLVDVTLSCEGQFLKAHKMVLSACSPYFQDLFIIHQTQHPVIILNGVKFHDLKMVVEFMYRGETRVLESELSGLLAVAEALQVKGLSNVRNRYEKSLIQGIGDERLVAEAMEEEFVSDILPDTNTVDPLELPIKSTASVKPSRKRKRTSEVKMGPPQDSILKASFPEVHMSEETSPKLSSPKKASPKATSPKGTSPKKQKTKSRKLQPLIMESSPISESLPADQKQALEQQNTDMLPCVQVSLKESGDDEDLAANIKVEPLFIRDIDDADSSWEDPARLVMDLPTDESEGTKSESLNDVSQSESDLRSDKPIPVKTSFIAKPKLKVRPTSELVASARCSADQQSSSDCNENTDGTTTAIKKNNRARSSPETRGKGGKIPRPPNAFMIFANEWRRKIALENPTESNKEISVRLGLKWKNLTSDEKKLYFSASKQADAEHKQKYPDYYYSPKEARLRKASMLALRQQRGIFASPTKKTGLTSPSKKTGLTSPSKKTGLTSPSKKTGVFKGDPLHCVKTYMKVSDKGSTNNDNTAILISSVTDSTVTVKEEVLDDESNAQNLEEEFLKMVEEGHVEAELEEDTQSSETRNNTESHK